MYLGTLISVYSSPTGSQDICIGILLVQMYFEYMICSQIARKKTARVHNSRKLLFCFPAKTAALISTSLNFKTVKIHTQRNYFSQSLRSCTPRTLCHSAAGQHTYLRKKKTWDYQNHVKTRRNL